MMTERIYLVDIKGNLLNSIWIEQLYTRQWAHLICLYLTTGVHFSIIKCKSVHFRCNSIPTFFYSVFRALPERLDKLRLGNYTLIVKMAAKWQAGIFANCFCQHTRVDSVIVAHIVCINMKVFKA